MSEFKTKTPGIVTTDDLHRRNREIFETITPEADKSADDKLEQIKKGVMKLSKDMRETLGGVEDRLDAKIAELEEAARTAVVRIDELEARIVELESTGAKKKDPKDKDDGK